MSSSSIVVARKPFQAPSSLSESSNATSSSSIRGACDGLRLRPAFTGGVLVAPLHVGLMEGDGRMVVASDSGCALEVLEHEGRAHGVDAEVLVHKGRAHGVDGEELVVGVAGW